MKNTWYIINEVEKLDTPALTLHRDRIQYNIDMMINMVKDPARLRPHVKTYKMPEIVGMEMEAGIRKFKCATIAEAEMLAMAEAPDVLLAYQPAGPKIHRLIELIKKYPDTRFSTLIDNVDSAEVIALKCLENFLKIDIYIDINNGDNRTGIDPDEAFPLFKKCIELKGLHPVGLHVYDGHLHDSDPETRKMKCNRDFRKVEVLADYIRNKLDIDPEIIAGGSPSFPIHAARKHVICSPGTSLLWDAGYSEKFPDIPFQPAAVVITRVISRPAERLICLDLGHKSIAGENPLENRVRFLNIDGLKPVSHSEEHLVVENTENHDLKVGDVIYGIPYHICPTVALYNEVQIIRNTNILGTWKVKARGRKLTV